MNQKFYDFKTFIIWHERLGHPLKNQKILMPNDYNRVASSEIKLIIRPSFTKIEYESPAFLEHIQGDICGPIYPPSGHFRYFMVLIDASTHWSHVYLLSTRNIAFAKLLAQIIRLNAQFHDHFIKIICLDNTSEFSSQTFFFYCMLVGNDIEYPVAHTHTQNGLVESLIKRSQLIVIPLLLRTKLFLFAWGHVILHVDILIRIHLKANHEYPKEDNEKLLGLKVPYYSVISALMYLENYIQLDCIFFLHILRVSC